MKAEWEYEQTFLDLQIVYRKRTSFVRIHESATVGKLTDAVHESLKVQAAALAAEKAQKAEKKRGLAMEGEADGSVPSATRPPVAAGQAAVSAAITRESSLPSLPGRATNAHCC